MLALSPPTYMITPLLMRWPRRLANRRRTSFVALDWALSIAAGLPWNGQPVEQGSVIYVAAEAGRALVQLRAAAWADVHGVELEQLPITWADAPVELADAGTLAEFIAAAHGAGGPFALVVVDTLGMCS